MTVIIECDKLCDRVQAHEYLAQMLTFPEYYGKNLDALFDCLTELRDCTLVLKNTALLQAGGYGASVLQVMQEAAQDNPGLELMIS